MFVSEAGRRPVAAAGLTTPASITTAQTIVVPTGIQRPDSAGVLECTIVIEGSNTSRYTWNGVVPTTTVGLLLPAGSVSAPVTLLLRGEEIIAAFKIIGTAAGNTWTYNFAVVDNR